MGHVTSVITKLARLIGQSLWKVSTGPANMSEGTDSNIAAVSSDVTRFLAPGETNHNGRL